MRSFFRPLLKRIFRAFFPSVSSFENTQNSIERSTRAMHSIALIGGRLLPHGNMVVRAAISAAFLSAMAVATAQAQLVTVEEKGLPSNSVFSGGDVDVVNLQNGNLHISIPITSAAQRGGGTLDYALVYDTQSWIKLWVANQCTGTKCSVNNSGYYVAETDPYVASGWRLTNPFNWSVNYTESGLINCQTTNVEYQQKTGWAIIDPQGTQHSLPLRAEIGPSSCLGQTLKGPTLDGSGMVFDSQANIIYLKSGDQVNVTSLGVGLSHRDRNGNLATSTSDTLERNLVTTTAGPTTQFTSPLGATISGPQYTNYTSMDSRGNPLVYRVDYQAIDFKSDICAATPGIVGNTPPNCTDGGSPTIVPAKLTLPTGKTYVFTYNNNTPGELASLGLPTGGVISYTYEDFYQSNGVSAQGARANYAGSRAVTKRSVTANGVTNSWTYTPSQASDTVTDPIGNKQVHSFSKVSVESGSTQYTTSNVYEMSVAYSDSQGNLLRTVNNTYTGEPDTVNNTVANVRLIQTTTTLENSQVSEKQTDYETFSYPCVNAAGACTGTATRMNPTEIREYDFGASAPGALLRRTDYAYLHTNNQSYLNLNIVDKPTTVTVYNGSGSEAAQTVNEYDNYSHSGQAMQASNAIQHDSGYGTSFTTRGNLTAVSRWRNTDGALLATTNQFDDAGNVLSTIDPGGHQTFYSFADSWASSACVPSGATAAFPTKVTNAKGQFASKTYYACRGIVGSTTDMNSKVTTYTYDSFDRPKQTSLPDGGLKTLCYSDDSTGSCYNSGSLYSTETDAITGSTSTVQTTLYDGLGRVQQTQLADPSGTDYVDAFYDADGRAYKTSNPYRSGDTEYTTATSYDGIGRVLSVLKADGSATYTTYSGNTTTITDEAGNKRKSQADGIGRMNTVWEDPSGVNYETDYSYDVLGNLLQVTQKGGDSNSADWRVRSFTYNSLSQLLCSANPEIGLPGAALATCPVTDTGSYIAGTVRYNYNNDSELTSKIAPLPNKQGTSTVTTTYSFDVLHRNTATSYSDTTPSVAYTYDNDAVSGCTAPTLTATYLYGHMKAMCDVSGATAWSYDAMGRTLTEARKIGTATDSISYAYYLNGVMNTITYPLAGGTTPFVMTYHENASGRVDTATGSDGVVYAQVNSTWASGASHTWQLGSNIALTDTYNARLQPLTTTAEQVSTTNTLFSRTYNFHAGSTDNGNLYGVTDGLDALGLNRPNGSVNYTYDTLNRVVSATTLGTACTSMPGGTLNWASTYTIDAWGNLTAKTPTLCTAESMALGSSSTRNQFPSTGEYDSAGNLTNAGFASYTYDAEGRIINGANTAYTYDGMGERVSKPGKLYWKGVGSTALVETNASDLNPTKYIFFNGARIARIDSGTTAAKFYVADNLGSTAVETDSLGNILNETLFFPYGAERDVLHADTANHYKFTGKERDTESGLDDFGARYYSSTLGRFMTPDWAAKPTSVPYASFGDPQTLNLYSYVENGPLNRVDADGHAPRMMGLDEMMKVSDQEDCGGGIGGNPTCSPGAGILASNAGENRSIYEAAYEAQIKQAFASTGNNSAQQQTADGAKASAQSAGAVSSQKIGTVWFNAYGGSAAERSAQLAAMSQDLTTTDRGGEMLTALEGRKSGFLGLWGAPKPFDIIQWANPTGSYSTQGGNFIVLDPSQIGMGYQSASGGGMFSLQRIFAHEMGHAAMGNLDNGPGAMNNTNWNENVLMRQLGDFNNRTTY